MSLVRDRSLAEAGRQKIEWARSYMPVLREIGKTFAGEKPLENLSLAMSIHLEAKTAVLALTLRDAGAEVVVTGCNPLSTQDDVAAGLDSLGVPVFAWCGATPEEYTDHLTRVLTRRPHLLLDDGGDLTSLLHGSCAEYAGRLRGGTEETTTGVHRLRLRAAQGKLGFPMMSVNDADCKHLFDNRYGTGQSTFDAIMHTTNLIVAGKRVVVAGYGWCGRGIALRAKGLGADVIVTEIDAVKAIEAVMDGCRVMSMDEAAGLGDLFITATGCCDVIAARHMEKMRDGALLCNAGHFDVEISLPDLRRLSGPGAVRRPGVTGYTLPDGRTLCVLGEGRLVNLACGNGHPAEIMDMSFAVQALALCYMAERGPSLRPGLYEVPRDIDAQVAAYKLHAFGIAIDSLTPEQAAYCQTF